MPDTFYNKKIFLFAGNARSGKDYIANKLKKELEISGKSVLKLALADELKRYLCILFDISLDELNELKNSEVPFTKNNLSMRQLLQKLGTDVFVKQIDEEYWIKKAASIINTSVEWVNIPLESFNSELPDYVIITDFRYPFETKIIDYLKEKYTIRTVLVENDVKILANSHPSETSLKYFNFDIVINNYNYGYDFNIVDFMK